MPHISFAVGEHTCLGLHLARLETRVALECLLDRLTNIELITDDDPHIRGNPFRSPTALPVTFDVVIDSLPVIKVMEGIRVLEVAQFTFVPAAGAILADWGADVIKVEHPVRGDTQRGFINMGGFQLDPDRHPLMEHPNRGKRSVGIDISTPGGQEVIYELAKTSDVFLTNYMPAVRQKNKFDVEHIRAVNPNIIYARGSAHGDKGAERDVGGYDGTAFWTRSGIGHALTPPELGGVLVARDSGVRRLHRRDVHRRRHLGRAASPRAHGRGGRDRRVAAEHGLVGGRGQRDAGHGNGRDDALADAGFRRVRP